MWATRRIIRVENCNPARRQRGDELALGPGHAFEVTEVLDVRHGDAGHNTNVRAADLRQTGYVAGPPGTHFEDDPLDVVRRVQERQGETELVVEGPLVGRHTEGRGEATVQQILGRRLADGARDSDHAGIHPLAGELAETDERRCSVPHHDRRPAAGFTLGQVGRRTAFEGRADEVVPIALGDDGNVELPREESPGVDTRPGDGDIGSDLLPAEPGRQFRNGESHASRSRLIV